MLRQVPEKQNSIKATIVEVSGIRQAINDVIYLFLRAHNVKGSLLAGYEASIVDLLTHLSCPLRVCRKRMVSFP